MSLTQTNKLENKINLAVSIEKEKCQNWSKSPVGLRKLRENCLCKENKQAM